MARESTIRTGRKTGLAAALSVVCALTIAGGFGGAAHGQDAAFETADKNADGLLDRGEFHARQVEVFYFLDGDKEGFLVVEELVEVDAVWFAAADGDGDGKLALEEFVNTRFIAFETADSDGDGLLTPEELEAFKAASP